MSIPGGLAHRLKLADASAIPIPVDEGHNLRWAISKRRFRDPATDQRWASGGLVAFPIEMCFSISSVSFRKQSIKSNAPIRSGETILRSHHPLHTDSPSKTCCTTATMHSISWRPAKTDCYVAGSLTGDDGGAGRC